MTEAILTKKDVLLSVRNLHTWFEVRQYGFLVVGNVRAVDGVDFDLGRSEAVAIVGESGCGKSTLARTILGLEQPTAGEIIFDNKRVSGKWLKSDKVDVELSEEEEKILEEMEQIDMKQYRSQVGYVQQDPYGALPPFMSIRRSLEEPMVIHGIKDRDERERRIREVMEAVKLTPVDEYIDKYPHMLSGGQQQRVVIARSKVLNPKFIVADEPVSMLDASVRVEILQILRKLQEESGLSVIYITHDLSTVKFFSERIFVMYGAKMVEQAPVKELLDNPLHPYTKALLEATSDPDAENVKTFKKVPAGEPPSLLSPPPGCRFHPRCEYMIEGLCNKEEPKGFFRGERHRVECWLYKD